MSPTLTVSTTARVLGQVRRAPRTIALIVLLPCLLLGLVAWMFDQVVVDTVGPLLVALFPTVVMFLVTSVAMLRERMSGTLERLMSMPLGKGDLVVGYALAFGALATLQALALTGFAVGVCRMTVVGPLWALVLVAVLNAVLGTTLGLAASAVARTEFQAVQMMPAVMFPQIVLGGVVLPRGQMPEVLEAISRALPLSYGVDAMQAVTTSTAVADAAPAIAATAAFIIGALVLGAATLRRRTP